MKTFRVLVTGGLGYIGAHACKQLIALGHEVTIVDLAKASEANQVAGAKLWHADIGDAKKMDALCQNHSFDALLHFAGSIVVSESVKDPARYYSNNVIGTLRLLEVAMRHGVRNIVFSSSAAVYGHPLTLPITEDHPLQPVNPYGKSKVMVEHILQDYESAYGLRWCALRYFNAAGCDPNITVGERHEPETHLIPLALRVAGGRQLQLTVYGDDYATADGTCVRDYVHVNDLAEAHIKALHYLDQGGEERIFNLGTGQGCSVKQVIHAVEKVTGKPIALAVEPRRAGDSPVLIAAGGKAKKILGWEPRYSDLETLITDAWQWELFLSGIPENRDLPSDNHMSVL